MGGGLTRREALAAGAVAVAGVALARDGRVAARAARGRALVVGAGLAGLTAASELQRDGWEVDVLEARDRLGGRVHTLRFDSGQHAEAGGEYIDTRHTAVIDSVHRHGLRLEETRYGWRGLEELVYHGGRRRLIGQFRGGGANSRQGARFWQGLYSLLDDVSVSNPGARRGPELDRVSMAEFLDRLSITGPSRFLLDWEFRGDYGLEPRQLSLLFVLLSEKAAWDQPDTGVEAFRIRGGNARLVEAIAAGLDRPVTRGSPVTEVDQGASGVTARTADGTTLEADQCVLAVPLPALRRIAFRPALANPLARAAAELGYATTAKTIFDCRRRFWRQRGFSGDVFTDLPLGATWEASDQQPGRRGLLISYTGGAFGRAAAGRSARRRIRIAADGLSRVFPGSASLISDAKSIAWASEPFSGGCWVCYGPGQTVRHWPALVGGPSDGRIHLAGEHTERSSGYMNSAIRSGIDAAARVRAY